MKKISIKAITEIGIFAAIGFLLDALQTVLSKTLFLSGGSIGLAMLPVLIISFRRGLSSGIFCGLIISLLQMLGGIYVISGNSMDNDFLKISAPFIQISLDYVLSYTVVGISGILSKSFISKKKYQYLIIGGIIGGVLKYLMHFLSGTFFWPGEIFGIKGWMYSLIYNGLYCIPNMIICCIFLVIIYKFYPQILLIEDEIID